MTFDDIDLENGVILEAGSGNKFRPEIVLPPVARSILEDQAREAREQGRSRIFDTTREKMTKAINAPGGMRDTFAEFERRMGRKLAGIKDLRKIVPSILAYELGYTSLVSKILGHESASAIMGEMAKMTSDFYTSPVFKIDEVEPETVALRAVENLFADTANMGDLRELPIEMNVSATRITGSNEKIPVVPQGQDLLDGSTPVPSTPEDDNVLKLREQQRISEIEAKTARADADKEAAKTEKLKAIIEQGPLTEEAASIKVESEDEINEARREARGKKKAELEAAEKEVQKQELKNFFSKANEALDKLPTPVKKVLPIVGTAAALQAAAIKGTEAKEAFERGEVATGVGRGFQGLEELAQIVNPVPITTSNVADIARRTPEEEAFLQQQRQTRQEKIEARSDRARSNLDDQMINLLQQP